jgi:TonB family protein
LRKNALPPLRGIRAASFLALFALSACASAQTRRAEAARLAAGDLSVCAAAHPRTVFAGGDTATVRRHLIAAGRMDVGDPLVKADSLPILANPEEIVPILQQAYPLNLRDRGIGGRAVLWLRVDEAGEISDLFVRESTGNEQLDRAALAAARRFRFVPAVNGACRHPSWIQIPVSFQTS